MASYRDVLGPANILVSPFSNKILLYKNFPWTQLVLTLMELALTASARVARKHHPSQQGKGTSHLLLTHPVLHQTQVGVVGGQKSQQGRVQA